MPTDPLPDPPPETREPVKLGPTRATVAVVCCPACGSLHAVRRNSSTGKPFAWWTCNEEGCGYWWKEPFMLGRQGRAAIA
jgi:hypothetical protein